MKKRKTIIPIILLIIFLVMLGFLSFIFFNNMKKETKGNFSTDLTKMGETIYKDYYYEITKVGKTDEELKNYLKKFETIGLSFNLVELAKYSDENFDKINEFLSDNDCSRENTKVIIYPKDPFRKIDFDSEVKIDCEEKK